MSEVTYRLPDNYRQLLRRYYRSFYRPLARGERAPASMAQQHFVNVCEGRLPPQTTHEFAYTSFTKFCSLSGIAPEEAAAADFTFPAPPVESSPRAESAAQPPPEYSGVPCPRCAAKGISSLLVWRRARDPSIPGEFLACSRYPHCQYKER
jgi:uncharacterized protein YifE (UPF0438 family)